MPHVSLKGLHRFFRAVSETATHACLLGGSVEPTALNQWVILGLHARQSAALQGHRLTLQGASQNTEWLELNPAEATVSLFDRLEQMRRQARAWPAEKAQWNLPMAGGLVGCFGYGFYRWCDAGWQRPEAFSQAENAEWPDLVLCEFEDWLLVNLESGQLVVLSEHDAREADYWQQWQAVLSDPASDEASLMPGAGQGSLTPEEMAAYMRTFEASFSQPDFEKTVEQLKADIYNGEIYQANLSMRLQKAMALDPYALFELLCQRNPSPFSGFFKWPGGIVVCNSPERLVQLNGTGLAQTRPIAGTRGRGKTEEEDAEIGQTLLQNEKELAEHLMLVDLARNDLGRVCESGSVQVDDLLVLERYSHVTHLVSNVVGQLRPERNGWDLIRATFPGGTITGCPKIRCVDILNAVEPVPRGFYTGSLGYLDAASNALDLNILIRSIFLKLLSTVNTADWREGKPPGEPVVYNTAVHVGAGIVHDAVGANEYRECLRKATASLNALYALENSERPASFSHP